jgi:hypothetical protein
MPMPHTLFLQLRAGMIQGLQSPMALVPRVGPLRLVSNYFSRRIRIQGHFSVTDKPLSALRWLDALHGSQPPVFPRQPATYQLPTLKFYCLQGGKECNHMDFSHPPMAFHVRSHKLSWQCLCSYFLPPAETVPKKVSKTSFIETPGWNDLHGLWVTLHARSGHLRSPCSCRLECTMGSQPLTWPSPNPQPHQLNLLSASSNLPRSLALGGCGTDHNLTLSG